MNAVVGASAVDVHDLMSRTADEVARWGRADLAAELRRGAQDRGGACSTVVVGPAGVGKSTLVDALLGARLCAGDLRLSTAVPVVVRWSQQPSASVGPGSDEPGQAARRPIPLTYVAAAAAVPGLRDASRSVEVGLPRRLLAGGLVLIDTPGLSGGLAGPRASSVLTAAASSDSLLYVVDPSRELSALDVRFLRRAVELCPDVVVLLTKIDAYREWRRMLVINDRHLREAGLRIEILPLSAPLRLHGLHVGDDESVRASGYPRLAKHLRDVVLAHTEQAQSWRGTRQVRSALRELLSDAAAQREVLESSSASEARQGLEDARAAAEDLRERTARWQQLLNDRVAELVSQGDTQLEARIGRVRREVAERLEATDPASVWRSFEPWLYERTNGQLLAHFSEVRSHADLIVSEVAQVFGEGPVDLNQQLDAAVTSSHGSADTLSALLQSPRRAGRGEMSMHAARGASLGVSLSLGGASLFGVTVLSGGWALPATAVVAAVVLGRRMVRTAKDAQLNVRRAEAMRASGSYLDEAERMARRESRDAVRRIQQEVRDHFTSVAVEQQRSAAHTLKTLEKAARASGEERAARLRALDASLLRLRPLVAEVDRLVGRS
jgi:hypothetical protein